MDLNALALTATLALAQPVAESYVTNSNDSGPGSLRSAITYANANPGTRIRFKLSPLDPSFAGGQYLIETASSLPAITAAGTVLDGAFQTMATGNTHATRPEIKLHSAGATGLTISAPNVIVKSIHFEATLVQLVAQASHCVVKGSYFSSSSLRMADGATRNLIGGATSEDRNHFRFIGIQITGPTTSYNRIEGNWFSLDDFGNQLVGEDDVAYNDDGIDIVDGAFGNVVGGSKAKGNVFGSVSWGVYSYGLNTIISGNLFGYQADGTPLIADTWRRPSLGIYEAGKGTKIGTSLDDGNKFSQPSSTLLHIVGENISVRGNEFGVDAIPGESFPQCTAIEILAKNVTVGGDLPEHGNTFGNLNGGVAVLEHKGTCVISNNSFGVSQDGSENYSLGVAIDVWGTHQTPVAKAQALRIASNVIGNCFGSGISLSGTLYSSCILSGNYLGVHPNGTPLPIELYGLHVQAGSTDRRIIAGESGRPNTIANCEIGIALPHVFIDVEGGEDINFDGQAIIRFNRIFGNRGPGIDFSPTTEPDGITANDALDADEGPNGLQNHPVITNIQRLSTSIVITGTLNSRPNRRYGVDFYSNDELRSDGHREGKNYIGSASVTTDASGQANFSVRIYSPGGNYISALASDMNSFMTSEFSPLVKWTP